MIAIAIIVGSLVIVGGIIALVVHFERKRTEAITKVAAEMGLEFSPIADDELLAQMQVFTLFNKGHSRKMKNVMKAETDAANLAIFDYQYTTGGGQHSQTHSQTVVAMAATSLNLPNFSLRPEGFFAKIGSAMGMQDIDFDHHPEFSKMFLLKGENEAAIRQFFDGELLDFFAARTGSYVESAPGVFIYLRGGRKKAAQIAELMNEGYGLFAALEARLSR